MYKKRCGYRSHDFLQTTLLLQAYTILCDVLIVFSRNLRATGMVIWHSITCIGIFVLQPYY